jgi:hypothetical protein
MVGFGYPHSETRAISFSSIMKSKNRQISYVGFKPEEIVQFEMVIFREYIQNRRIQE